MSRNLKLLFAAIYILCLGMLLFFVFSYLDIENLNDYSYIKDTSLALTEIKNNHLFLFILAFFILSVLWILLLGFASPLAILSGFLFGQWYGTIISLISFTVGCTLLYLIALFYFRDLVKKYLENKIIKYKKLFNKNEFFYFMVFRFVGGGGIPFAIQNLLPTIFNMKTKNYFYSTFLGLVPTVFIVNALGAGIENLLKTNENLSYLNIISDPGIHLPIIGFLIVICISVFVKKKFL